MSHTQNKVSSAKNINDQFSKEYLQLIKGIYTPSEAREVLMSLISSKISFHAKKNLQSYEQYGEEDQNSKERIKELEKMRKHLLKTLKEADNDDLSIKIESQINIECLNNAE